MRTFEHYQARSIKEAIKYMEKHHGQTRFNAGGTDRLGVLKGDLLPEYPEAMINLKSIPRLRHIREKGHVLEMGALTRLVDIAESPVISRKYPILSEAARSIASPQIRNMATLGGNLCQDVRCWYYRYPRNIGGPIHILRKGDGSCLAIKGDNRYHAIIGGKGCFAICPSDMATALASLRANLVIAGPDGEREVPLKEFYHPLGNDIKKNEILKEIQIPVLPVFTYQKFIKFTLRKPVDFALVSVAVLVALREGQCEDARISLGGVAPSPVCVHEAEQVVIGRSINEHTAEEAAEKALSGTKPLSKNGFKVDVAKTLIKRAILGSLHPIHSS